MAGQGDCFRWALWDAVHNGGTLVHGWLQHPGTGVYAHAWVERDGLVYDWQSCDQGVGPCPQLKKDFYQQNLPDAIARYPSNEVKLVAKATKEGHYGPWHPKPWSDPNWKPRTNPYTDPRLEGNLYRGSTDTIVGGSNLGVLGAGVYLTWQEDVALAFARLAADKYGGQPIVECYKIKQDLNLLSRDSQEWAQLMRSLGFEPWDNVNSPQFSAHITNVLSEQGYDGVISHDPFDGLVIFDDGNVIGYVDRAKCECGKRKLQCERCHHWWCAFGCEKAGDCPECSVCKRCGNDELEECYDCDARWCSECDGYDCPNCD